MGLFDGLQDKLLAQVPGLIASSSDKLNEALRSSLAKMTPPQKQLFLQHWSTLDTTVRSSIGGKRKGLRRTKRRTTK